MNQSIQEVKLSTLRKHISLVSQDTTLFDDTIKNNILYANIERYKIRVTQTYELMLSALDFIEKLPNKSKYNDW